MEDAGDVWNSALLVIDMQNALVEAAHGRDEVLEKIGALLDRARAAGVPVIYLQHDHGSYGPMKPGAPGWRIHENIAPLEGEAVIRKRAADSFYETPLEGELRSMGVERVVVTGMSTEYCVDATSRSALSHGFDVTLVEDGHATVDRGGALPPEQIVAHHNETLASLEHPGHGVLVSPEAEITFSPRD